MINDSLAVKSWYLIFTKPRMEGLAKDNLSRQRYQTFLPRVKVTKRIRGRYACRVEAMFPRYLFIHLDTILDNWMPIRSTLGVSHMVRFGGTPAQVPDQLVEQLIGNQDGCGINILPTREMIAGDRVEILEGPMAGYIGTFEHASSTERVRILLKIVGNYTRVNIDRNNIQLAI
ncbi:MAG: transcription/translation regulatory transformer protein RfaH [Gammaproteobacteria bacterium]|nr:transcription/translation regulatory transformer protein RfaH [Gammaproteobacteria bacterium]